VLPLDVRSNAAGHGEHGRVGVQPDDSAAGADQVGRTTCHDAGTAGDIEDALTRVQGHRVEQV
jgi:hypothetical protein